MTLAERMALLGAHSITARYEVRYPDGTTVRDLDWSARKRLLDAAPVGTTWHTAAGDLCGTVEVTRLQQIQFYERAARTTEVAA